MKTGKKIFGINILIWVISTLYIHILFVTPASAAIITLDDAEIVRFSKKTGSTVIIHLPEGEYSLSKTLKLSSDTILEGTGPGTVIKLLRPFSGGIFITNADHSKGNSNITIRKLAVEFDAPSLTDASPGILRFENMHGLEITDMTMRINSMLFAIDLASDCSNALIENCTVTNIGSGGGLMVRNRDKRAAHATTSIVVRKNSFLSQVTDEPIAVYGWLGEVRDVIIQDNKITAHGASFGISVFGIEDTKQTGTLSNVIISNNIITGAKTGGIGVKGGASDVQVLRNTIELTTGDGIFLHSGGTALPKVNRVSVKDNVIRNIGHHGIFATGVNIDVTGNKISDCKQAGIYVGDDVRVTKNVISNSSPGVLIEGTKNRIVRENILNKSAIKNLNSDQTNIEGNLIQP